MKCHEPILNAYAMASDSECICSCVSWQFRKGIEQLFAREHLPKTSINVDPPINGEFLHHGYYYGVVIIC